MTGMPRKINLTVREAHAYEFRPNDNHVITAGPIRCAGVWTAASCMANKARAAPKAGCQPAERSISEQSIQHISR